MCRKCLIYFLFAYYFTRVLCPFHLDGNRRLKNARIYQIFNDCICFIFITILLSMSFQATDLPNFIAASSRCGTDFSGYLSSYQCRDFSILPQQVKCQVMLAAIPRKQYVLTVMSLVALMLWLLLPGELLKPASRQSLASWSHWLLEPSYPTFFLLFLDQPWHIALKKPRCTMALKPF